MSSADYNPHPWHELFAGLIGADATLAGLIFVAVSLNHDQIVPHPRLPGLAMRSLTILGALVVLSAFVLTPGQSRGGLGVELVVLGAVLSVVVLGYCVHAFTPDLQTGWRVRDLLVSTAATVPTLVAGVSLVARAGGGLYWAMGGALTGLLASLYYAWILLVEISR